MTRNDAIRQARRSGRFLYQIAEDFGLSTQRVGIIVRGVEVSTPPASCPRCGHAWNPRKATPLKCPRCFRPLESEGRNENH